MAQEYLRVAGIFAGCLDPEKNPDLGKDEKASLEQKRTALYSRAKRCRGKDRKAVLDYVHTGPETLAITGDELDADPALLACASGVIDLDAQDHRPGRQEEHITLASPAEWRDFEADAAPFLDFLKDILSDNEEMLAFMLRFLGMALFGRQREHAFLVLYGESGRNGKDTLMGILRDVLGKDLCADVAPEMFMEQTFLRDSSKPSPDLLRLRGKRIIYASESSKRHRFNSEVLKKLTGGNELSARGLNEGHLSEWTMTHTIILLTNELPEAPPDDDAFWVRLYGVELKRRYLDNPDPENPNERPKDPDLRQKMQACGPGILAALVKGYGEYRRIGLQPPPEVTAFSDTYRANEDVVGRFLSECCIVHKEFPDDNKTQASELYDCFAWWYTNNVYRKPASPKFFGSAMSKKGFERKKISNMFYLGVVITPEAEESWRESREDKNAKKP